MTRESNPGALVSDIEQGSLPITLDTVLDDILKREQLKLHSLPLRDLTLRDTLYTPSEQIARLASAVYKQPPPNVPFINPVDAATYAQALDTWLAEHPFLNGANEVASVVFGGMIGAWALRHPLTAHVALERELGRGSAANPFLSTFYLKDQENGSIPAEHLGAIYSSIRSGLSLGDTASLAVDGADDAQDEEALKAEIEININRRGSEESNILRFETDQVGTLRLGSHLEDVEVSAPLLTVSISGPEAILVAPISIQCERLDLRAERLVVESPPDRPENAVFLEAAQQVEAAMTSVPTIRGKAALSVSWPGARAHPWTAFATEPTAVTDPRLSETLRRFRKFIISFRSHSKGSLKRYRPKLDHARMTKGTGLAVLQSLRASGILAVDGSMYTLHPQTLADVAGASYIDSVKRNFSERTLQFVASAIA